MDNGVMSDELMKILTVEEVAKEVLMCKLDLYRQIDEIHEQLADGTIRMDNIENILSKHEKHREDNYQKTKDNLLVIQGELMSYRNDLNQHDKYFHTKMEEVSVTLHDITGRLGKTAEDTDANSTLLTKRKKQEEIDKAVQEALAIKQAPYKEYRKQAILAVVGIVAVSVMTGLWKLIMFIANLDELLLKGVQ